MTREVTQFLGENLELLALDDKKEEREEGWVWPYRVVRGKGELKKVLTCLYIQKNNKKETGQAVKSG